MAGAREALHQFEVGALRCTALSDGGSTYTAEAYVANAEPAEVVAALARHGVLPEEIWSPFTCLLIESPEGTTLIDSGIGPNSGDSAGKLAAGLAAAGITPEQVGLVVLTHAHPDHVGWLVDEQGQVVFANARHVLPRAEWDYWSDPRVLESVPEPFSRCIRQNLLPLVDRLDLVEGEVELAPGIRLVPAAGHTPGHAAVLVESEGDELIYVSDAALHPIHLEQPSWHPTYDLDPEQALASKRMLFDRASDRGSLVLAFHFPPFPSLGRVSRAGNGWAWQALPG